MTATPCPWCSEPVRAGLTACGACGAALVPSADGDLPGLTTVVDRGPVRRRKRNRLVEWLTGTEGVDVGGPKETLES